MLESLFSDQEWADSMTNLEDYAEIDSTALSGTPPALDMKILLEMYERLSTIYDRQRGDIPGVTFVLKTADYAGIIEKISLKNGKMTAFSGEKRVILDDSDPSWTVTKTMSPISMTTYRNWFGWGSPLKWYGNITYPSVY